MPESSSIERNDKKLAVLRAAGTVFLAHGFSAATTDMIQREAGVSKATMYACFPNKEAMFAAVVEQKCKAITQALHEIQGTPDSLAETLTAVGLSYLRITLSPEGLALYRVVVSEAPRFPNLGRLFYQTGPNVVISLLAARLTQAARAGEINLQLVGVDAAAMLFLGMLRAEGHQDCVTHPDARPSEAQINRWVQLAVTTFLAAFGLPR
ncbi:TetR family transcriptional regulator [Betaproteobacteria bacterium]|nr:TetR family transcriptional regulator [Betaproteobacteria bacterium]